jgi:hypothetical protein
MTPPIFGLSTRLGGTRPRLVLGAALVTKHANRHLTWCTTDQPTSAFFHTALCICTTSLLDTAGSRNIGCWTRSSMLFESFNIQGQLAAPAAGLMLVPVLG